MSDTTEFEVLQRLVPELQAEGYEVYVHPNKPLLPSFLNNFSPDVIALRGDKKLAIEVLTPSALNSKKLERMTELFQNQKDWELRIIWINSTSEQKRLQVQDITAIEARISEVKNLTSTDHIESAMLLAWATFEALARAILTSQFARPQTPGRIVQVLAGEGYLTPTEADLLRTLAEKRNKLIHGELQVHVSKRELGNFLAVLETMLDLMPPPQPRAAN